MDAHRSELTTSPRGLACKCRERVWTNVFFGCVASASLILGVRGQRKMRRLLLVALATSSLARGAEPSDLDFVTASSLPRAVSSALSSNTERLSPYVLSAHINPYYLQGDFDGDGVLDTAVLLRERATGKAGVLILGGRGRVAVLGAGRPFGNGGDDFRWMNAWYVYPRAPVRRGADGGDPPTLRGDALMLVQTESASALVHWAENEYVWYQQGD